MKKVLFTLLALGASCTALAQSSVTIYGVADAGLVVDKDAAGDRLTRVASGVASGSRIGFKGKEDLGNGLSALFVLESGFNIDTGTSGQGGLLFGRQAYVGLSGKGGTVTLGRQYSPYYLALRDVADPFVIGLAGTASNVMATNYRVDNMAQYATPTWNKLSAELAYGFGEVADDNAKNRSLGGAVHYIDGPLNLTVTHHRKENALATADTRNSLLAMRYDFGVAQGHLGYADNRALDNSKSNDVLLGVTRAVRRDQGGGVVYPPQRQEQPEPRRPAMGHRRLLRPVQAQRPVHRLRPYQQQERRALHRWQRHRQRHRQHRLQPGHASSVLMTPVNPARRALRPAMLTARALQSTAALRPQITPLATILSDVEKLCDLE